MYIWYLEFEVKSGSGNLSFLLCMQSYFYNACLLYRSSQLDVTYLLFKRMCCVTLLERYLHVPFTRSSDIWQAFELCCARYDRHDHWIIDQKQRQTRSGLCHKCTTRYENAILIYTCIASKYMYITLRDSWHCRFVLCTRDLHVTYMYNRLPMTWMCTSLWM